MTVLTLDRFVTKLYGRFSSRYCILNFSDSLYDEMKWNEMCNPTINLLNRPKQIPIVLIGLTM